MKKSYKTLLAALLLSGSVSAQEFFDKVDFRGAFGTTDWSKPWANWTPANTKYPGDAGYVAPSGLPANPTKVEISGQLNIGAGKSITWTNDKYYELNGLVEVLSGTLIIQEGTVIRGKAGLSAADKGTLLVGKEAKIEAVGTAERPIIMTSGEAAVDMGVDAKRNRGDWGGLLLIGKATSNSGVDRQYEALPTNTNAKYGGADDMHSSGTLKYVRIEFAGNNPSGINNSEINGLTFAGCGMGTKADYIQVSYCQDDSFEWFGGTTMHKYLIAFAGTDDDFDTDEGYRGKIQFALAVKHPAIFELAGTAASNGIEADNNTGLGGSSQVVPGINNPTPVTSVVFSNITMVGPIPAREKSSALSTTAAGRFGAGVLLRTNNSNSIFNSIITGFNVQLNLNHPNVNISPSVQTKASQDSITVRNTIFGYGAGTSKFASSNIPTGLQGWGIKSWIVAGPVAGTTGATDNDTSAATIPFKMGLYEGSPKGAVTAIDFSKVDYSLTVDAAYLMGASFEHPKLKKYLITGLNDANETNLKMIVSPNPANGNVQISTAITQSGNLNVTILDMKGNVVANVYNGFANSGTDVQNIETSNIAKGIYIVRAITGSTIKTVKLVLQ